MDKEEDEDQEQVYEVSSNQSQAKRSYTKLEYLIIKSQCLDIILKNLSPELANSSEQKRSGKSSHPDGDLPIFQFSYSSNSISPLESLFTKFFNILIHLPNYFIDPHSIAKSLSKFSVILRNLLTKFFPLTKF